MIPPAPPPPPSVKTKARQSRDPPRPQPAAIPFTSDPPKPPVQETGHGPDQNHQVSLFQTHTNAAEVLECCSLMWWRCFWTRSLKNLPPRLSLRKMDSSLHRQTVKVTILPVGKRYSRLCRKPAPQQRPWTASRYVISSFTGTFRF